MNSTSEQTGTKWLDDNEMAAWRSFIETQADLLAAIEADLAPTGLTLGDYQVLVFLSDQAANHMRMCDLAELLQLSPSGLTRRLDGLVKSGLVERCGSEQDRRVMLAVLTDTGRQRLADAAPTHVASVRHRMIDQLDTGELAALASAFGKIRTTLDA